MGYPRFPDINGARIAFLSHGDVWIAELQGEDAEHDPARVKSPLVAWRFTTGGTATARPRLSPDGRMLSWTDAATGKPEVYCAPVEGGQAHRLSYWSLDSSRTVGWTPGGDILAVSAAGQPEDRWTFPHRGDPETGRWVRQPWGPATEVAVATDGATLLASANHREPAWWKRYRGGTAVKLWLDPAGQGQFHRLCPELDGQIESPMFVGDRVAFLSDHEGVANLYSCTREGEQLRRHTDHGVAGDPGFYARHAATDGHRVIYRAGGYLYLLDGLEGRPVPLPLELRGPSSGRQEWFPDAAENLDDIALDRTGRASAVEVRGTVQWLTHQEGPAVALRADSAVRARLPQVLGDSGFVAWVSDVAGEECVEIARVAGAESSTADAPGRDAPGRDAPGREAPERQQPRRLGTGALGRVLELCATPDGRAVIAATHDNRLVHIDVDSGELTELLHNPEGDLADLAISPDSAWLACSRPGPEPLRQILLVGLQTGAVVEATPLRFVDTEPVFTLDGRYLAFLSARSFDPVYDQHVFDMSFPTATKPQLLALDEATPLPFGPLPEGRAPTSTTESGSAGAGDSSAPAAVRVEPEGIARRVVPLPVGQGNYSHLHAAADALIWLEYRVHGSLQEDQAAEDASSAGVLQRYDLRRRVLTTLAETVDDVQVSGDGSHLVLRRGQELTLAPADHRHDGGGAARASGAGAAGGGGDGQNPAVVQVDLSRVRVRVDPVAQWRQAFDEAGRLMRDHFWIADMAGVDWQGVLETYRPLVEQLGCHSDFVDLLWETQGELGTSHAYVIPPARPAAETGRQGWLGADLEPTEGGGWRIARIVPGDPSDPLAESPLQRPGAEAREGELVLQVNGHDVGPSGVEPLLVGTAERATELVLQPATGGPSRRVVVVPLAVETRLRYQDWVHSRRAMVAELSGGRLGYLHVPDMVATGWAQLHRDLRVELAKDGVIADVRANRGGHLSELVVEKLARRVIGWQSGRERLPHTYPLDAPRGPVVLLANQFSGSDGDIVNQASRLLGVGPVVGERTWGGVVGIDMRYGLVDGTMVTQPRYACWFDEVGWSVENYGVAPDDEVVMTPQDWGAHRDPQLQRGVERALQQLEQRSAARPPSAQNRASRARPEVPPRS